jgi:protein-tyrosine phosphatase
LLESDEAGQLDLVDEQRAVETQGIRFISFPIPDRGVPASAPAAISLMTSLASALDEGKNIAVHCRQGVGRSGLIAAGILATSGMHPAQAIEVVGTARGLAVPETSDQRLWVQELRLKPPVVSR